MLEQFTLELFEKGKIEGSHFVERDGSRTMLDGRICCTFSICEEGSDFYEKINNNDAVVMAPASRVVIPEAFHGGLGINNILAIDFQGHVNCGGRDVNHYSGIGGAGMINRGLAQGGVAYLCLKSTHKTPEGVRRSSVFDLLPRGTPVSLVGPDVWGGRAGFRMFLVTEQGVARLSGKSQSEYIKSIISVAHPDYRADLKKQAWDLFRVSA
jgi:acyl-CoA hydrolase